MGYYYGCGNMGSGILGGILMLLIWILIIWFIIWIIRKAFMHSGRKWMPMNDENPIEILKKRYAKGEIDKKEFEERKKDLEI